MFFNEEGIRNSPDRDLTVLIHLPQMLSMAKKIEALTEERHRPPNSTPDDLLYADIVDNYIKPMIANLEDILPRLTSEIMKEEEADQPSPEISLCH